MSQTPVITYDEAIAVFERPARLAKFFGISRASVAGWKERGVLPENRCWQLIHRRPDDFKLAEADPSALHTS